MNEGVVNGGQKVELRSTLAWPLLGLLIERSSYGYELARRFERVYGEDIRLGGDVRIYETLEMLNARQLIEELTGQDDQPRPNRQPRLNYRVTAAGVRAYKDWLVGQFSDERRRSWLFARQLGMLEPTAALIVIERYETECLDEANETEANKPDESADIADRLAAEDERLALGVRLSWLQYVRRELKGLIAQEDAEQ